MSGRGEVPTKKLSFIDPVTFTPHFSWKRQSQDAKSKSLSRVTDAVECEGVALVDIADKVGTPTYVYSLAAIQDAQAQLHRGLGSLPDSRRISVSINCESQRQERSRPSRNFTVQH
jgi:nicotinamide riboside transporter PnuC